MAKLTDLWVNIGAKVDGLTKGLNQAEKEMKGFGNVVNKIGGMIAGAFAISKIAAFTTETIRLASEMEGVSAAFKRVSTPGLLNDLRDATKGTVSDLELMKSAVQANNFKIPLTELASLLAFANKRAQDTGQSVDYLVQSIVMGIGRKSPLILDNLGISATSLRAKLKGAGMETASVATMAKAVADIANEEMAKSGGIIETTAIKLQNLNANWKNTKTIIGEMLIPTVTKFVTLLNQAVTGWQQIINPQGTAKDMASSTIDRISKSLQGLEQQDALKVLQKELANVYDYSRKLKSEKHFIFGKDYKEASQQLAVNEKISTWLKGLFYDTKALAKLTTPPVLDPEGLDDTSDELENIHKRLLEIWATHKMMLSEGKSRTEAGTLPVTDPKILIPKKFKTQLSEASKEYMKETEEMEKANAALERSFRPVINAAEEMAPAMVNAFGNVDSIKDFGNAMRDMARQVILSIIAQTMAENMAKAVRGSKTWWGAIIQGAAAAAATSALFKMIPSFAEGGVVRGKQLAMVGDNPSGVEAIIPSEKWGKMGMNNVNIQGVVRGKDLYWTMKNYTDYLNRTT